MDEYVTKPLRRGDLLASIAKVLMNKLPMLTSSTAGLPSLSGASGLTVSASQLSRGLSPVQSAHILELEEGAVIIPIKPVEF
jgi:hypothetical protein